MDNIREQMDIQEEIGDAMSQPLGINVIDEAITTNSLPLSPSPSLSLAFLSLSLSVSLSLSLSVCVCVY